MQHTHGTYDISVIVLSYLIAVLASYTTLDLAGRIRNVRAKHRWKWVLFGAVAMGMGIWSMHFVGMLALSLPVNVRYDVRLVAVSVVAAVLGSYGALYVASHKRMTASQLLLAGLILAAGICAMHYIGMDAMLITISYNVWLVALSVAIAIAASIAALWLSFMFHQDGERYGVAKKLGSGLVMGAAIAGMHYTGMWAADFHVGEAPTVHTSDMLMSQKLLAYSIVVGSLITLGFSIIGTLIVRRLELKDSAIETNAKWYKSLYDNNQDGIITVDLNHRIIGINPAASRIACIDGSQFLNQPFVQLVKMVVEEQAENVHVLLEASLQGPARTFETAMTTPNGERRDLHVLSAPVEVEGEVVGYYIIFRDATNEKKNEARIKQMAYQDELTGLPNRRKLNEEIELAIEQSEEGYGSFAVMVMDIDRFKMINDSLGHQYGDLLLKEVATRLHRAMEGYEATAARIGGDEFTILYREAYDEARLSMLAERIIRSIQKPYRFKEQDYYVSASIGIARYPEHGSDAEQLLKHADMAMYEVKKHGKNGFRFFTADMQNRMSEQVELERDLRLALTRNDLLLHYQPQISTVTGKVTGVEALVRWEHPERGLLSPAIFIPLAEEVGLIGELGDWVLREACAQMRQWHLAGGPRIPVAVNLSSEQFHQSDLADRIALILQETGLEPQYLELEITESMMMDVTTSTGILHQLNGLGVRISLDDFGTGYSSLNYLKLFPIHKLKIDRSFIRDITVNDRDQAIVATIISMARHLKLDIIAEGIETKAQLDILRQNDCSEIQGYYFSRPLPPAEAEVFVRSAQIQVS